jgi:outer membrane protein assembly factor BamA
MTFNQELRFPLRLPYTTAAVTGALFYDAGNVYTSLRTISLRTTPPPGDLNWLSHSIGFGVHYPTPVGPIRIDFGYLLNAPQFQFCSNTSAACPSVGNPVILGRQRRFQFFLTFGAPF